MRLTITTFLLTALAVTATAAPTMERSTSLGAEVDAVAAGCKHQESYDICRANCSPIAPGFACAINCLIAYCA
ncbi:hypothetical protein BCR34DRAFT_607851 [Clohesyomyces aquaticus]|uniref:Uncharacterized protein n=1 Tax=Clohesyomyces aquaticus TaxID=1231657 RepID=A0A1Y1YCS9_9PLEO|nr:hypothetical protein BCR34DRAFT_607851 [Clohesyomyces aquaticus]